MCQCALPMAISCQAGQQDIAASSLELTKVSFLQLRAFIAAVTKKAEAWREA